MNWTAPPIVLCAAETGCQQLAAELAAQSGLSLFEGTPDQIDSDSWALLLTASALTLRRPDGLSTEIDFIRGKATARSQEASFKSQPLARSLGLQKLKKHSANKPSIIDATAGFGTDGWMLASLGCDVVLLEASPVLSTMLLHALNTARTTHPTNATANSVTVLNVNSASYLLDEHSAPADIIYLDPMYPQTNSRALVKKGMQLLHELIGPDTNGAQLLNAALCKADYRVVVKRPRGAPLLDGSADFSGQLTNVQSPHTRFDIYHTRS